jgi:hypothetical protein
VFIDTMGTIFKVFFLYLPASVEDF